MNGKPWNIFLIGLGWALIIGGLFYSTVEMWQIPYGHQPQVSTAIMVAGLAVVIYAAVRLAATMPRNHGWQSMAPTLIIIGGSYMPLFLSLTIHTARPIPMPPRTPAEIIAAADYNRLESAVKANDVTTVRTLLAKGSDANNSPVCDPNDGNGLFCEYPLVTAAKQDNLVIARLLIQKRAMTDLQSSLPLSIAARHGDISMMRLLIRHGAVVNGDEYSLNNSCALWYAVDAGQVASVKFLLGCGANPRSHEPQNTDADARSVLAVARSKDNPMIVAELLHAGAKE